MYQITFKNLFINLIFLSIKIRLYLFFKNRYCDLMKLGIGKDAPKIVNAFIEIPMGSNIKYEIDEESGILKVDRVLFTSMVYPFNYGFVAGTLGKDGDPLDILVMSNQPFLPGSFIKARPIGVAFMTDEEGEDTKIIAVPIDKVDPNFSDVKDVADVSEPIKRKIKHFFEHYKELEPNKWVKITGYGSADDAYKMINDGRKN